MSFISYENYAYLAELCEGFLKNIGLSPDKNELNKYLSESIEYFGGPEHAAIPVKDRNKMVITRVRNIFEQREAARPDTMAPYFQSQKAPAAPEDDTALFFQKLDYLEAERKMPPATAPQVAPTPIPAATPDILMPPPPVAAPSKAQVAPLAAPIIINSAERTWATEEPARDIWTWTGPIEKASATIRFIRLFGPIKGTPGLITITGVGGQTETLVFDESGCALKGLGQIKNLSLPWKISIKGFNGPANFRGRDGHIIRSIEKTPIYTFLDLGLESVAAQEFAPGDECVIFNGPHFKIHGISNNGHLIVARGINGNIIDKPIINLSRQTVLIFAGASKN